MRYVPRRAFILTQIAQTRLLRSNSRLSPLRDILHSHHPHYPKATHILLLNIWFLPIPGCLFLMVLRIHLLPCKCITIHLRIIHSSTHSFFRLFSISPCIRTDLCNPSNHKWRLKDRIPSIMICQILRCVYLLDTSEL